MINLLKIDCEGAELDVLLGLKDAHWPKIEKVIAEVHDIDGRLDKIIDLLTTHGITEITVEKEAGFERTVLCNVHAVRTLEAT